MSLQLTETDLEILEALRLERFRRFYGDALKLSTLHFTLDARLIIVVTQPSAIDTLLAEPQNLCYYAHLILAAQHVTVYFAEDEVWNCSTEIGLKTDLDSGDSDPMPATLERPASTHSESQINGSTSQVDLLLNTIRQIESLDPNVRSLIPIENVEAMIDDWAASLKAGLRGANFSSSSGSGSTPASKSATATRKPAAKKASPKASS